jgi:hypothetical protein
MQKQTNIIQTEEDKIKRRLSLTHEQRYKNAMRMLRLSKKIREAGKQNQSNGYS